MPNIFTIHIDVEVRDDIELYEAAREQYFVDVGSYDGVDDMLRYPDEDHESGYSIDISACLQMLADPGASWPGTSILQSYVGE